MLRGVKVCGIVHGFALYFGAVLRNFLFYPVIFQFDTSQRFVKILVKFGCIAVFVSFSVRFCSYQTPFTYVPLSVHL